MKKVIDDPVCDPKLRQILDEQRNFDRIEALEQQILSLQPGELDRNAFALFWSRIKFLLQRVKEVKARMDDIAIADIQARNSNIVVGDGIELTTKAPPKHSSRDNAKTLDALLKHAEGDVEAVARDYLVSEPFKAGAIRAALGDAAFAELFETTWEPKVEEKGAKKKLTELNRNFIK